jgi:hypothetical protein
MRVRIDNARREQESIGIDRAGRLPTFSGAMFKLDDLAICRTDITHVAGTTVAVADFRVFDQEIQHNFPAPSLIAGKPFFGRHAEWF